MSTDHVHTHHDQRDQEPFYVGYLPVPGARRRMTLLIALIGALWFVGAGLIIAASMPTEPGGVWETGAVQNWTGTIQLTPYPMLVERDPTTLDATGEVHLLVGMGKFGVHDRVSELEGALIKVEGYPLSRDGRQLIELAPELSAIETLEQDRTLEAIELVRSSETEHSGEIVDGKCYLGAMNPGHGMGHRACAVLCIEGGLPPMFAYTDQDGSTAFALLVLEDGSAFDEDLLGMVAAPVRVVGSMGRIGGLQVLIADQRAITLEHP